MLLLLLRDFDEDVDRIIIQDSGKSHVCYNLKKVAKYGFCRTTEWDPRHWGFCSRTCDMPNPDTPENRIGFETYEEATFRYYPNHPHSSQSMFPLGLKLKCLHFDIR